MTAKRDLKILENGIKAYCLQIGLTYTDTYGCNVERLNKTLTELEAIKSADGSEAMEELNMIRDYYDEDGEDEATYDSWKIIEDYILKAQAQERELEELKGKVSNIKNYTRLIDFLNIMKVYEWTNESDIIFEVGFGDGKETKEITAEELRKDYADYNVLDYDLYHEVTDDNYILKGWIEIETFENICKGR